MEHKNTKRVLFQDKRNRGKMRVSFARRDYADILKRGSAIRILILLLHLNRSSLEDLTIGKRPVFRLRFNS
jgi:hypothetical protein